MTKEIQIRGNCQCCGREQAVVNGSMSKHGYTVQNGWFQGVCEGNFYKPMQVSRVETDNIVDSIRKQIPALLARAEKFATGEIVPEFVIKHNYNPALRKSVEIKVPFAEASSYDQKSEVNKIVWSLKSKAAAGKSFSDELEAIANKVHGQPLNQVAKKEVTPIRINEQKINKELGITYTCIKVDGARVYWKAPRKSDGKIMQSWMGSQAWRKLENV